MYIYPMLDDQGTHNFGQYIDQTFRIVRLDLIKRFKQAGIDITPEQWILLSSLYENDGQSQIDLANGSFKNAPTVSRIIDLLCNKGLTQRERFDGEKRRYKIVLTAKGKKIVERAFPEVVAARKQGWKGLSKEDYGHLRRILKQLFENLK